MNPNGRSRFLWRQYLRSKYHDLVDNVVSMASSPRAAALAGLTGAGGVSPGMLLAADKQTPAVVQPAPADSTYAQALSDDGLQVVIGEYSRIPETGRISIGLQGGYEHIGTEVTNGVIKTNGVYNAQGIPKNPFQNLEPQTIRIDPGQANRASDYSTDRTKGSAIVAFDLSKFLSLFGNIGVSQADYNADSKLGFSDSTAQSGSDLNYGGGARFVFQLNNRWYIAAVGSFSAGESKDCKTRNPLATADVRYQDIAGAVEVGTQIGNLSPHGGIRIHQYKEKYHATAPDGTTDMDLKGRDIITGTAGLDALLYQHANSRGEINRALRIGVNGEFGKSSYAGIGNLVFTFK